jgi:hypothetical protein
MMPDSSNNRQPMKMLKNHIIRSFENLQAVGHKGEQRYNCHVKSMLSAWLVAPNIVGKNHHICSINGESLYHENFTDKKWSTLKRGNRMMATGRSLPQAV